MISDVITGKDSRLYHWICSADNEDSVCDYVSRLTKIQEDVKDQAYLIPRIYTNKPRTTGEGYKGITCQPDPEKKLLIFEGLIAMRKMHIRAIQKTAVLPVQMKCYTLKTGVMSPIFSPMWQSEPVP